MAGHMGAERVTTQNLTIVRTDIERGLIMVKGSVPGSKGGWVFIRDAVKHASPKGRFFPRFVKSFRKCKIRCCAYTRSCS